MSFSFPLYYIAGTGAIIAFLIAVLIAFFFIWVWKLGASLVVGG